MQKILIVEDDLAIQALLHDFIQEAGYSVVLAADGVEALAKYSEQPFDLVLLDIMLPKIDGYGVCEVIRQKSEEKVYLTIENTGVHIPEDDISKLFEPFYRVEQSRNRQTGGSGLGLYIVKTIINLHNAEVKLTALKIRWL